MTKNNQTPVNSTNVENPTLIINRSDSMCGNCGGNCDPNEKTHITNYGFTDGEVPACGVKYKFLSSNYIGMKNKLIEMRPDLIWIDDPKPQPKELEEWEKRFAALTEEKRGTICYYCSHLFCETYFSPLRYFLEAEIATARKEAREAEREKNGIKKDEKITPFSQQDDAIKVSEKDEPQPEECAKNKGKECEEDWRCEINNYIQEYAEAYVLFVIPQFIKRNINDKSVERMRKAIKNIHSFKSRWQQEAREEERKRAVDLLKTTPYSMSLTAFIENAINRILNDPNS